MSTEFAIRWLLFLLFLAPLQSQDYSKLPEWARTHADAAGSEMAPVDADAWVLFDRTEVAYAGDGEIRTRRLSLVKVLSERSLNEGTFVIHGLGGKSSEVKKLRGWNLRPDGDLTKLDQDRIMNMENVSEADVSTDTITTASLPRVVKGSLIAFESLQVIHHPMGPVATSSIMRPHPIRRWELEPAKQEGWFTNLKKVEVLVDRRHFEPWLAKVSPLGNQGIAVDGVPALPKQEAYHPAAQKVLPTVGIRFLDPDLKGAPPWKDWNVYAAWMHGQFADKLQLPLLDSLKGKDLKTGLDVLSRWMAKELHYRQVYLSPERGWIPLSATETGRRRYGDCKDLTCFLMAQARQMGVAVHPALARIMDGEIEADVPPSLMVFNHVITAIRLDQSLGFAAEVDTPKGRFLLIDPTDRFTPVGFLGEAHRMGRVLICTTEGGIWAQIPDAAIHRAKVTVSLHGQADAKGALKASLKIDETGNAWGMRGSAQAAGRQHLRTYMLASLVDLPPTATFEITQMGDPMELGSPFSIEIEMNHPEGFRRSGNEASLVSLGWRILPNQIQKPGVSRQYPVEQGAASSLDYSAEVLVPFRCIPVLAAKAGDTPFRTYSWAAGVREDGAGTKVTLQLRHESKRACFDFDHREEGVAASKKDRSQIKNLMADGLAFKVLP